MNMKKIYMLVAVSCLTLAAGMSATPVSAQTSTNFNVGMRIVDPCVMKGQKWADQCVQLKRQRAGQNSTNKSAKVKKPVKVKQPTVRHSLAD